MSNLAERKNEGKLRWRNFPMFLMTPLAEVGAYGEGKYKMFNYLKGGSQNQYLDCMKRHLTAYEDTKQSDLDPESGVSHLAHVAWNALVAIYMLENFPELDDRFKIETDARMTPHYIDLSELIPEDLRKFLSDKGVLYNFIFNYENEPYPDKELTDIGGAFSWNHSPEGSKFWAYLRDEFAR